MSGAQAEPGVIYDRESSQQVYDFSGLKFGTATPTDIDGVIAPIGVRAFLEWNSSCYVFYEFKHKKRPGLPGGQRKAIERICDDLRPPAIAFVCLHETPNHLDLDCGKTVVDRMYWNGEWQDITGKTSARHATKNFIDKYGNS